MATNLLGRAAVTLIAATALCGVMRPLAQTTPQAPPPSGAPVRAGGDVPAPQKTKDVRPLYPAAAQADGVSGIVILEVTIDVAGRISAVNVLRSPDPRLTQAATEAVRQWEYAPTIVKGVPMPIVMTVTVNFAVTPAPTPPQTSAMLVGFLEKDARLVVVYARSYEVWDIATKTAIVRRTIAPGFSTSARALSPDGRRLAMHFQLTDVDQSRGIQFETRLVDVSTGIVETLAPAFAGVSGGIQFSADSATLVRVSTSTEAMAFHAWRLPTRDTISAGAMPNTTEAGPVAVAVSPDGSRFAFVTFRRGEGTVVPTPPIGRIRIVDTRTGTAVGTAMTPNVAPAIHFSGDGRQIYWGHAGDTLVHINAAPSGQPSAVFGVESLAAVPAPYVGRGSMPATVDLLAVGLASPRLVAASRTSRSLAVWNTETRTSALTLTSAFAPLSVAISRDGRLVAVGGADRAQVIDVGSGSPTTVLDTAATAVPAPATN